MACPWAEAGYECFIVDIQHPGGCTKSPDMPGIWRRGVDLLRRRSVGLGLSKVLQLLADRSVQLFSGLPVLPPLVEC